MNARVMAAAAALADILDAENEALLALDFPRVVALLERKHAAADAFAGLSGEGGMSRDLGARSRIATQLEALAAENKTLLERAIDVQGGVIAAVLRAAPRPRVEASRYTAAGAMANATRMPALALSARA